MFPVNFVNASGSSSREENVLGNKENKLNNGFECYNVGPSYWAEREREVFNRQNRNVAAELNPSSSSGSVNVFNSSFSVDTNCSDSQSRNVPVGSKYLSSSGRFVPVNSSRKVDNKNIQNRNVSFESNQSLNGSFNLLNSSFNVDNNCSNFHSRNVSLELNDSSSSDSFRALIDHDYCMPRIQLKFNNSEYKKAGSLKKKSRGPGKKTRQDELNMERMEKAIKKRENKARKVNPVRSAFFNIDFVTLWLLNSEDETAQVGELYKYHFPCIRKIDHWRNTIRNALSKNQGFQRVQNEGFSQKRGFWQFALESKERLIISVQDKINKNQDNLEKLRMRNLEDLSAILEGKCPAPADFQSNEQILNVSTSDVSFNTSYSTINESFQNSEIGDLPEDFLDFEPSTSPECSYSEHTFPIVYNSIPSAECVTKENDENVKPAEI